MGRFWHVVPDRTLLEAVRDRVKVVDLKQVNRVLLQPHWRDEEVL